MFFFRRRFFPRALCISRTKNAGSKDRFRVFDRAVSFGKELSDGKVADKNYVWFSEWQLQNINSNHLLPIDLEAYRELKNHIAKALVPLLQIWLYATRERRRFRKTVRRALPVFEYPAVPIPFADHADARSFTR